MDIDKNILRQRLRACVAAIPWVELARFQTSGILLEIAADLDFIEVAVSFSCDETALIQRWRDSGSIRFLSDERAETWSRESLDVWALVVGPWVLVQKLELSLPQQFH